MNEKLDISRIGSTIELDPIRIDEVLEKGTCTFVSPMFYNKGVYRVKNSLKKYLENFAINIHKIEAATYQGLVEEFGEECVDTSLWDEVPEGSVIFFYSFKVEKDLVKQHSKRSTEFIEA
jgi:alanine-alpha-ketoisovalerate/valine-pyruvate aminotransferase